ncbi:ribonucleoside-diphosphate reductase subunit alpha [Salsuginibacillus kocurii]|uniref:ribonucleoside-diphosphate reductase subunit alpha n=1 Tax=Salsuginibacillus kocurii TaxID=427078 RepID=UPI00037805C9|nr:ribonucleoside-diphosphate reductase subunit alpha [Salsuginibacillus kocurii]
MEQVADRQTKEIINHLQGEGSTKDWAAWLSDFENLADSSVRQKAIQDALGRICEEEPEWTYAAAAIYLQGWYEEAGADPVRPYQSFYERLQKRTEDGMCDPELLEVYTKEDIDALESEFEQGRDQLFTYIGLKTLADRYAMRTSAGTLAELPQERYMVIAMKLMVREEVSVRLSWVKEAYWALSNQYMTVATPTFANAGKCHGQLSSCFIDTVDDSLISIYETNTTSARVSKDGGGLGVYLGKIRAKGSSIKGFPGVSSGVMPWMKQLNNTAVSVDQLGQRQGAIAVYLDVWHLDIFSFLDAKLNNGDERQRTHDLFTGVSIPDLFMEKVEQREDWYLFDPHEVREVMGFSLEDSYDEEEGSGTFRERYEACVREPTLTKQTIPAIEVMKRIMVSQLETGTPYMFYRDTVNRLNPNRHKGMVYASNLCTEIMQNMSPTTWEEEVVEDGKIITTKTPGDYVVCNLSSLNLAKTVQAEVLQRVVRVQMRMLDNVIDVNTLEIPQAKVTNKAYRPVGLGTFGWHHLLALKGISWESEEAVQYADKLYEEIHYEAVRASNDIAKEKGSYEKFAGSDWETGAYFDKRGYTSEAWQELRADVEQNGLRNGYLMAVAPNASTSLLAGSTASIDPVFKRMYAEEKKNYKIPVTAPDLSPSTYWYYKESHLIDQSWSIRQNAARQRHVDQGVSFNIYVQNDIKAKDLLDLHLSAWQEGLKTTYYVRSTSAELEECEVCSS